MPMRSRPAKTRIDLSAANGITALEALVLSRLGSQVRDFRIVRGDRGLLLRGLSVTYYAKQLAQHAVMEAADCPIEANEIEVCSQKTVKNA
jgi:hypothetical protein